MVKNKKISYSLIIKIGLLILSAVCLVVGIYLLVNYVPSIKNALFLATTKKSETFTELYFEDHLSLPSKIIDHQENKFKFTIHNLENKDMQYPYEVYIDKGGEKQFIDQGSVYIKDNEYITIPEHFRINIPTQSVIVVVNLIDKNQQIHFLIGE